MAYFQSIMGYFRVVWPITLGHCNPTTYPPTTSLVRTMNMQCLHGRTYLNLTHFVPVSVSSHRVHRLCPFDHCLPARLQQLLAGSSLGAIVSRRQARLNLATSPYAHFTHLTGTTATLHPLKNPRQQLCVESNRDLLS